MEFAEAVARRRMVRNYRPDPVDQQALQRIIDTGRRGPSAGFSQGISFVVVTDAETRSRIADLAGEADYVAAGFDPWISTAPVHALVCVRKDTYLERYGEADKGGPDGPASREENWPVPYWWVDAGASLMLVLLAVVDEGLAAGFLGAHDIDGLKEAVGIPADVFPIGIVTIGHAAPDRRSGSLDRGWKDPSETVHHERW